MADILWGKDYTRRERRSVTPSRRKLTIQDLRFRGTRNKDDNKLCHGVGGDYRVSFILLNEATDTIVPTTRRKI